MGIVAEGGRQEQADIWLSMLEMGEVVPLTVRWQPTERMTIGIWEPG